MCLDVFEETHHHLYAMICMIIINCETHWLALFYSGLQTGIVLRQSCYVFRWT